MVLTTALRYFLTPSFVDSFKETLRKKLSGNTSAELEASASELVKLQKTQSRLSHMLANYEDDDVELTARYEEVRLKVREAQARLATQE